MRLTIQIELNIMILFNYKNIFIDKGIIYEYKSPINKFHSNN